MSGTPERPALRRFLRGLAYTSLSLLLPCQLTLLWLAKTDQAIRLPEAVMEKVAARLAEQGVRFRARALLVSPDRSLRAEDVRIGIDGAGEDVLTAQRVDLRLSLAGLFAGRLDLTGLKVTDGRLTLPAGLTGDGRPRPIVERADCDLALEGGWVVLRSVRLRTRGTHVFITGESPLLQMQASGQATTSLPSRLRQAEEWARTAESAGISSVEMRLRPDGAGGCISRIEALAAGMDYAGARAESVRLEASLRLSARGAVTTWSAQAEAAALAFEAAGTRISLSDVGVALSPVGEAGNLRLTAKAAGSTPGWPSFRCETDSVIMQDGAAETQFTLSTGASRAQGRLATSGRLWRELSVRRADLCADELLSVAALRDALKSAVVGLTGSAVLRDARFVADEAGRLARAEGAADFSGLTALGLSSRSILPGADLPLTARFDFDPSRAPKPLRLSEVRLASVSGEAELSLSAGGPFTLHLRGELAHGCLDQVLGRWWTELWSLFRARRHPYAYIDVEGEWMKLGARTTGRVKMEDFDFMGAPFRGVEVMVDAGTERTVIGLEDLAGGSKPADGSVDGTAIWDWRRPPQEAGPYVEVSGDLDPWVAARCAGKDFGEALKGLRLPAGRRLKVSVRPGKVQPAVAAEISAPGLTDAWGFPLRDLKAITEGAGEEMLIRSTFGLAEGRARLDIRGDALRRPRIDLEIAEAGPQGLLATLQQVPPPESDEKGRLELKFKGEIDLKSPLMMRGLGTYRLTDPELRKVRLLGGLSALLEELGVGATSYELTEAKGHFGCLEGRAYFPDMVVSGPQAMLSLAGESDLVGGQLDFLGDFSLLDRGSFPLIGLINPNRALISLTKIRVKGPFSKPTTTALPRLSDIVKLNSDNDLGKIPPAAKE